WFMTSYLFLPDAHYDPCHNVETVLLCACRPLARKWILMLFMGTCLLYCARMAMPICAVSMAAIFHWSKIDSGLVLGGFFWGYCFTQILGGHASDKVGGERVLLVSAASWALITAGTPLLAQLGSHTLGLMMMARFLMGVLQGVFFPSLASLCSQRVVEGERGFLMSTMNSGAHLGTLVAGGMGSFMLDWYGWESMFYCIGFLSTLWALVVWQYLLKGTISHTRWLSLFKKPPVWAMVFAHMCICSTSNTLLSWLPTYFKESFPHATGWVYNVIPWLAAIPAALCGGYVSDFLIIHVLVKKNIYISCFLSAGYGIAFVRKLMQVSMEKLHQSIGVSVNVQDLTPSCAGALYGDADIRYLLMCCTGVVLVSLSGYLIEVTLSWATVFSLITLVNATGLAVFLIFGDAQRVDLENYSQVIVI
uniref:Solute carrier family 17 member 9 n=1 Tax=Lates calcarifer TaxID=8187 RepID=A0A4W6EE90_LATCA